MNTINKIIEKFALLGWFFWSTEKLLYLSCFLLRSEFGRPEDPRRAGEWSALETLPRQTPSVYTNGRKEHQPRLDFSEPTIAWQFKHFSVLHNGCIFMLNNHYNIYINEVKWKGQIFLEKTFCCKKIYFIYAKASFDVVKLNWILSWSFFVNTMKAEL